MISLPDLVLIDTCIWVPYFNRPQSREKIEVDLLLDDHRATLIGPVLTEILMGFRRKDQADWVASEISGLVFEDVTWEDWRHAAELGRRLAANGHRVPLTDLILSAVAIRTNMAVYSVDPHFDLIENLRRFTPTD